MDFSIKFDIVKSVGSILYIEGSQVTISKKYCIFSLKINSMQTPGACSVFTVCQEIFKLVYFIVYFSRLSEMKYCKAELAPVTQTLIAITLIYVILEFFSLHMWLFKAGDHLR